MKRKDFNTKTAAMLFVAVLSLAAGLRLWQSDRAALWEDDYLNLDRALLPLSHMWDLQKWQGPADTPYDFQPPLSFALEHLALSVSKTSAAARAVSLAAGIAAVWGMFALGRGLFGTGPGLLAALLLSLSLLHIEYSRAIKAYGLFFCFSVWSCVFVHAAATRGRARDWAGWAVTSVGMLYSAYIGLPAFAGQALWAAAMAGEGVLRRRPGSGRQALLLTGSAAAATLAYLPWLPAVFFLQRMFHDPGVDPWARLTWAYARDVLAGFQMTVFQAPEWLVPAVLALSALGGAWAFATGRGRELLLLLLWVALPTGGVLLSRSVMTELVTSRHVFNVLGAVTLLPAAGAWAAGAWASRFPKGGPGLALAVGAALCLALSWPQLARITEYYERSISVDRDIYYWLRTKARPGDALSLDGWKRKSKAFGARWYLPDLFASPGDIRGPGYRSLVIVENQSEPGPLKDIPEAALMGDDRFGPFRVTTRRLGVLSRSPVPMVPDGSGRFVYQDDFTSHRMLADVYAATNAAPDLTLGHLAPVRSTQPADAVYRFTVPAGVALDGASLDLGAVLYKKNPGHPADASIEVLAGPDPHALKPLRAIAWKDFLGPDGALSLGPCKGTEEQPMYQTCARTSVSLDLAGRYGSELWLAVRFRPGVSEGFLELDRLRLEGRARLTGGEAPDAARLELASLLANNRVQPWKPGAAAPGGLFAFAAQGGAVRPASPVGLAAGPGTGSPAGSPVGSPEDLRAFQAEHPGLAPVHVFKGGPGIPAVSFYDPPLMLSTASPRLDVAGGAGFEARGMVLSGTFNAPSLKVGAAATDILVAAPAGTTLLLNPGGRGKLIWSPDFSREAFPALDISPQDNLRPSPDADNDGGLTCQGDGPCRYTARFVSALPVKRVRLEWYPRVVADPSGKNRVRLSYSTDEGKTFLALEDFGGDGSGKWTRMFGKHARELVFGQPVNHFLLRFELSGEDAQLWSHRRVLDRMWLEADLDARSVRPPVLPGGAYALTLGGPPGNNLEVAFSADPIPLSDAIKDWR